MRQFNNQLPTHTAHQFEPVDTHANTNSASSSKRQLVIDIPPGDDYRDFDVIKED